MSLVLEMYNVVLCLVTQSCLTFCNPMDCNPPGSSVHGILQARILEWVAMPSSRGSSQAREYNPAFPHCRQILYHLSHQGHPRILEWVVCTFSRGTLPAELPEKPKIYNRLDKFAVYIYLKCIEICCNANLSIKWS